MKNRIATLVFVALSLFSCKKNETSEVEIQEDREVTTPETPAPDNSGKSCYQYTKNKDTLQANFVIDGKNVTGDLAYKFYEKDKSSGTVVGTTNGDTIYADYIFQSEGMKSVREVAFLRHGDMLHEGYGDMEEKNGKMVFKDKSKLEFKGAIHLTKIDCK